MIAGAGGLDRTWNVVRHTYDVLLPAVTWINQPRQFLTCQKWVDRMTRL